MGTYSIDLGNPWSPEAYHEYYRVGDVSFWQGQYTAMHRHYDILQQQLANQTRRNDELKQEYKKLKKKYKKLKKKHRQLEEEVRYVPGHEGAIEAQKNFEALKHQQE